MRIICPVFFHQWRAALCRRLHSRGGDDETSPSTSSLASRPAMAGRGVYGSQKETLLTALVLGVSWFTFAATTGEAADAPEDGRRPSSGNEIPIEDLDESIERVIKRSEYDWRLSREAAPKAERGLIGSFIDEVGTTISGWLKPVKEWARRMIRWLEERMQRRPPSRNSSLDFQIDWQFWLQSSMFVLLLIVAIVLVVVVLRGWKRRRRVTAQALSQPVAAKPNIEDENIQADELPPDEWQILARDLLARGELRLALRAFYLSGLAHLSQRELITIARFKSNRDYENEVARRAHYNPELGTSFSNNVGVFERSWYGMHDVNQETVQDFTTRQDRIRALAEPP